VNALAEVLTLGFMLLTQTVHPPAGANPLIMVHSQSNFAALWQPVFVGGVQPGCCRVRLEPPRSGPGALSGQVARHIAAVGVLGRVERITIATLSTSPADIRQRRPLPDSAFLGEFSERQLTKVNRSVD
jgi:hypothetical protein